MQKLSDRNIRYIYQIGDIHIRGACTRNDEYKEVFDRLIKDLDGKNSIVVCTGDIFNDEVSLTAIDLAKYFFIKMCDKIEVIVIRGNHDYKKTTEWHDIDKMTVVLKDLKTKEKLHIINTRGMYEFGNVVFGYTDVYDCEVFKISNEHNEKIKIGLWHGIINGSRLNNSGIEGIGKINVSDFSCYDMVMLGDIHKFQYVDKNKKIAYCGSLIQQDHGEDLMEHGYLKWDLETKKSEFKQVTNRYGFITVNVCNDIDNSNIMNKIPEKTHIKIRYTNCTSDFLETLKKKYEKYVCEFENKCEIVENYVPNRNNNNNTLEEIISRINKADPMFEKICEYVKKMMNEIKFDEFQLKNIRIKQIKFDNIGSYGEGNVINYDKLNGIVNLCGMNGVGKTLLSTIIPMYAMYGDTERKDLLNNGSKYMSSEAIIDVNNVLYTVKTKGKISTTHGGISLELFDKDGRVIMDGVEKYFGSKEMLVNISMTLQHDDNNFVKMKDTERFCMINTLFGLDVYEKIISVLSKNKKTLIGNDKIYNDRIQNLSVRISDFDKQISMYEKEKNEYIDIVKKREDLIEKINKMTGCLDKIKEFEELNVTDGKEEIEQIAKGYIEINKELEDMQNKIDENRLLIEELHWIEKENNEKKDNNLKMKNKLRGDLDTLYKKFIKIDNFDDGEEIKKKILIVEKDIKKINSIINTFGKDNICKIGENVRKYREEICELNDEKESIDDDVCELTIEQLDKKKSNLKKESDNLKIILEGKRTENLNDDIELLTIENKIIKKIFDDMECDDDCDTCKDNWEKLEKIKQTNKSKLIEKQKEKEKNKLIDESQDKYEIILCELDEIEKKIENRIKYEKNIEIRKKIDELTSKIIEMEKISEKMNELKILEKDIEILKIKLNESEKNKKISKMNDVITKKVEIIKSEINKIDNWNDDKYDMYKLFVKRNNELISVCETMKSSKKEYERVLGELKRRQNQYDEKMNYLELNAGKIEEYKKLKETLMEVENKYSELITNKGMCDMIITEREKAKDELDRTTKNKNDTIEEIDIMMRLMNIIGKEITNDILNNKILKEMSKRVNEILKLFVKFEIDIRNEMKIVKNASKGTDKTEKINKIQIKVKRGHDREYDVNVMSGFETMIVSTAIRIVINEMNGRVRTDWLVIDEGFGVCDKENIDRMPRLYEYLRGRYRYIMIVNHIEKMREFGDKTIEIEKGLCGKSKIVFE